MGRRRVTEVVVEQRRTFRPRQPGLWYLLAGFAGLIIIGTLLLLLPFASRDGHSAGLMTALFTSTSAVCVTGLVVVDTWDHWSGFGQGVILLLIQLGGLGFMTSSTLLIILLGRRVSILQRVIATETLGRLTAEDLGQLIRRIAVATLAIEAAGATVLAVLFAIADGGLGGRNLWRGVFTSVSAFNNAGFDLEGGFRSLTGFSGNAPILIAVAVLTVFGSTGYAVWSDVANTRRWHPLALDTKIVLVSTSVLWLFGAAALLFEELPTNGALRDVPLGTAVLDSVAGSVYMRTSGFTPIDFAHVQPEMLFVTAGLMFIGGASASTAGGIKLTTFSVLGFAILSSTRGEDRVTAFEREIPWRQVNRALSIALLAVAFVFALSFALATTTDAPFVQVFFEAVSAFADCGLSAGITRGFDGAGQVLLVVGMYVGRLGPLTIALALAGRGAAGPRFRYAEETVSIG